MARKNKIEWTTIAIFKETAEWLNNYKAILSARFNTKLNTAEVVEHIIEMYISDGNTKK